MISISALLFTCLQFAITGFFIKSVIPFQLWIVLTVFIFFCTAVVFAVNIVRAFKEHDSILTDRRVECLKNLEQLGVDLRLYFAEMERERLHRAANRNKFAVPPDVAEALAKEYADLDHQAKIEPCPGAALNQRIHPLPEEPEPSKN